MSRMNRATRLALAARQAARGGTTQDRELGIRDVAGLSAPQRETAGAAKAKLAWLLKEKVALLKDLEGEALTKLADRVVEIANALASMPDRPGTDDVPIEGLSGPHYWLRDD